MSHGKNDQYFIDHVHNTARFFVENPHISWTCLVVTILWGIYGYLTMPQRKDPDIPVKQALALYYWQGVNTELVEQQITKKLEEKIAQNAAVEKIETTTRVGMSILKFSLKATTPDPRKEFDDIRFKLESATDLPSGSGPLVFVKDFGDTASLMLTVASPRIGEVHCALLARAIDQAWRKVRPSGPWPDGKNRIASIVLFPPTVSRDMLYRQFNLVLHGATQKGLAEDAHLFSGAGFLGVDSLTSASESQVREFVNRTIETELKASEAPPDLWPVIVVADPTELKSRLEESAIAKYSYRQLDDYSDLIRRTLEAVPAVSKVERSGVLNERIYLYFSQDRLASYGLQPSAIQNALSARNIPVAGGVIESDGKLISVEPTGEFQRVGEIGDVIVGSSHNGTPLYLRDAVQVSRTYESPPTYLNFYNYRDKEGNWQRARAVTLSVQMRSGEHIEKFARGVTVALDSLRDTLPHDLILAHTSDQPLQVRESIGLFMKSLWEAIILVVVVSLIGFWEWRSATLLALSIPIALAMTAGMMRALGIDMQQVSIATLIIALGLLVDDPVVASDAIKRDLGIGHPPIVAAWLGPTKLATAILFATITNIAAYLPFLMLSGDTGHFLYSLPVVMTCSLVASRIVSMTFVPFLGKLLLRPGKKREVSIEERRHHGFPGRYHALGQWAIEHRWQVLGSSLGILLFGSVVFSRLSSQFFPKDLSYLSYVDVWLPQDAAASTTGAIAQNAEEVIRQTVSAFEKEHYGKRVPPGGLLKSLLTFVGGGGPRFWFSLAPEPRQQNYAQIVVELTDKHATHLLIDRLQEALSSQIPGARFNARLLETGPPVGNPVALRLIGDDRKLLRKYGDELEDIFRKNPFAERVQNDWGSERMMVQMQIDPDRASLAGVTNADVALSTALAMNGRKVGDLREKDKDIPVVLRMVQEERARLSDIGGLYVYASNGSAHVPMRQVSQFRTEMGLETIARRQQFRTLTVSCFPTQGHLASQVLKASRPELADFQKRLPSGLKLEIGGEQEKQRDGFRELGIVMGISIILIFLALVAQFRNAIKPLIVFAAIPYGIVGALVALWVTGTPFGFMAFLGVASLVGVIVSHVIVLFDFIEEARVEGKPLIEALLDAGIVRLRPVLITVGATVFALFPLASHGGPLWEPLCYAQIGGLLFATMITLILVPVIYSIAVLDLKILRWP